MSDRLIELETKVAFQEATIQDLNKALSQQQQDINQLQSRVDHLLELVKQLTPSNIASEAEETPPPHY